MNVYKCEPDFEFYSTFDVIESEEAEETSRLMRHSRSVFGFDEASTTPSDVIAPFRIEISSEGYMAGTPNNLPVGDFGGLSCSDYLAVSPDAVARIGDTLSESGHYLPTECNDGDWKVFIVDRMIDAFDESSAKVRRWPDGRISEVKEFAFLTDRLKDVPLFILKGIPNVFATELFVEMVREVDLTGLRFELTPPDKEAERRAYFEKYSKRRKRTRK